MWSLGEVKIFFLSFDNSSKHECNEVQSSRKGQLLPVLALCFLATVLFCFFSRLLLRRLGFGPHGIVPGTFAALLRDAMLHVDHGMLHVIGAVEAYAIQGFSVRQKAFIVTLLYSVVVSILF
ncbi:uncharacterized protein [Dermacentor albipictus]|uniref:uncharacterized protein n=1 Tax=Dermacentor albipictus TaxID=60249 RepID=UPI0038FCDB9F